METFEVAAKVAHEANRAYCEAIGDTSHVSWSGAPNWHRESYLVAVKDFALNPKTTAEQSHKGWLAHKTANGWMYGPEKCTVAKTHPCMLPYDKLPVEEKRKDAIFGAVVRAVLGL